MSGASQRARCEQGRQEVPESSSCSLAYRRQSNAGNRYGIHIQAPKEWTEGPPSLPHFYLPRVVVALLASEAAGRCVRLREQLPQERNGKDVNQQQQHLCLPSGPHHRHHPKHGTEQDGTGRDTLALSKSAESLDARLVDSTPWGWLRTFSQLSSQSNQA